MIGVGDMVLSPCKPVHGLYLLTKLFCEKHRLYHEHFNEMMEQRLKVRNYVPESLKVVTKRVDCK